MALPAQSQVKIWSIVALVLFALLWTLGDVILPFVLGAAVAYLLDPIADWFEARGFSRVFGVTIITIVSLFCFVLLILLVIPTLIEQAVSLFATIPDLARTFQDFLTSRFPSLVDSESTIRQSLNSLGAIVSSKGAALMEGALSSVSGLLGIVMLLVIVPVVAFYMLLDWDNMVGRVDQLLPRDHAPTIRRLAREIDQTLAGFIRGQGTVCFLLGAYYCVGLVLVGLDFGLVIGAVAGALTFIPYIGSLVGGTMAIGFALFQFWGEWPMIAAVAAIFFSGQMVEGNVLTPKLVGGSVGLHPVWLLLALSVFGSLFGFVGMLVAVPVSAVIGVLVRFVTQQYLQGLLYRGEADAIALEQGDASRASPASAPGAPDE